MDNKKKQCGKLLYKVQFVLLFSMVLNICLFIFSDTSFASELTPSNQMTAEIAENIINYVTDNSVCNYVSSSNSYKTFWNNFSANVNYENFASAWNSSEIPNNCDYLEQCVLVLSSYDNKPFFKVFFNNNMIGNSLPYLGIKKVSITTFNYYYRDDNNTRVAGNRVHISLTDTGLVNFNLQSTPASGNNSDVVSGGGYALDSENSIFTLIPLFTIGLQNSIYINQDSTWRFNIATSVVEVPTSEPDIPDVPVDTGNTGTITDNNGDKTGEVDLSGIQAGIGNLNNNINEQGQAIVDKVEETGQVVIDTLTGEADFEGATVTQEDIENSLNIEQTVGPYDNFVMTFINGLISSLTDTSSKDFTFKVHTWGETYTVKTSDIIPQYGEDLSSFLRLMSVIAFGFVLIKWSTKIVEALNVADVSKTLELVEEKYSNLL